MAKRKRSGCPPQLQHGKKSTPSQQDKRGRLANANPIRRKTSAASVPLLAGKAILVIAMQSLLHARIRLLVSAGKIATSLALSLLRLFVKRFDPRPDGYPTLAIEDSPTIQT